MSFGDRIKKLRIEKKWTQEYVCEKLNISSGALSRYETDMYEPKSLELIKDFANLFEVSTDYLLGKSDIRNPKEETKINDIYMHLAKEAQELKLDKEDVDYIINFYKKHKK